MKKKLKSTMLTALCLVIFVSPARASETIGEIAPPAGINLSLSAFFNWGLTAFFTVMGILVLYFMLTAAVDYLGSGGDPKKIEEAQAKIRTALIAIILSVALLSLWIFLGVGVFHFLEFKDGAPTLKIPSVPTPLPSPSQ
jgi:hypothetical protein